jgi:hypothetical protein
MSTADDLDRLAQEELAQAASLKWSQLAALIPWGDTYEGISPANLTVQLARSYLWAGEPGGDILCEVRVYLDEAHFDYGAKRSAVIRKPGG